MEEKFSWTEKIILLILLLGLPVWPLLKSGYYPSHDGTIHLFKVVEMSKMLEGGQFPVRWAANFNFGFGVPAFNFYPPLFYYLTSFAHLAGLNFFEAIKAVAILSFILSAGGMFFLSREIWSFGSPREVGNWAGIIGAFTYIYIPYRFLDVYVRGAYPEFLALGILPWFFWAFIKLGAKNQVRYLPLVSLSLAALVLTHNFIAMMAVFISGIYFLVMNLSKITPWKILSKVALGFILGIALSSFFWLPALYESKYLRSEYLQWVNYKDHFPVLGQLIHSPWGYGSSLPGLENDGMTFELGKVQLVLALIVFFIALPRFSRWQKIHISFWFYITLFIIFLILPHSDFIWKRFYLLRFGQYPWRLLGFTALSLSLLSAGIVSLVPKTKYWLYLIVAMLVIFNLRMARPSGYITSADAQHFNDPEATLSWNEWGFWPQGVKEAPSGKPKIKLEGEGEVTITQDLPTKFKATINSEKKQVWQFNTFYFPGWVVRIDGAKANMTLGKNGEINFESPQGKHEVTVGFKPTSLRRIAESVSLVTLSILAGWVIIWGIRNLIPNS